MWPLIKLSQIFAVGYLLFTVSFASAADQVSGPATVVTGDVLIVDGRQFKLTGIVVPALSQTCEWPDKTIPCGDISRTALLDLVVAARVDCEPQDSVAVFDATLTPARCFVDGFDVGRNMVHTGWAISSSDEYRAVELKAKAARRGLWKGDFDLP